MCGEERLANAAKLGFILMHYDDVIKVQKIIGQLKEELGREPTSREIETSMISMDEGMG